MRLFVLGATGGIGRQLLTQSLERGHTVTAFVRSPQKLGASRERLTVLEGDPRSATELQAALSGHDAVFSALGPPGPGKTTIHRDAARATVTAMESAGVRRLLIVSAAILFDSQGFFFRLLRSTLLRNIAEDTEAMERIVTASRLDYTIARPPRLTNGRLTGRYAVEDERMPRGGPLVSRADVAHFLLEELERNEHVRRMVGMASAKGARGLVPGVEPG